LIKNSQPFGKKFQKTVGGTVSLHISHQHSCSRFSSSVLRLLLWRSYPDLITWHSEFTFCCGHSSNFCYSGHIKNVVDDDDASMGL